MPSRPLLSALLVLLPALVACGGGAAGGTPTSSGDPTPHVSYSVDGTAESLDQGLAEAGGVPHAEVYSGTLAVFAASTDCSRAGRPPPLGVVLFVQGATTGTFPGHLFQQDATGAATRSEAVSVTVTRLDADDGLVEASFRGDTVTGELVARRGDSVGFFTR